MGQELRLPALPKRIVSLVPSQTELLVDLGLEEQLVGITKFCIHPDKTYKSISKVGGTKDFNIEKIRALQPDLIIGNKEENEEKGILALMQEFPVWMSDIKTFEDALQMIDGIGELTGTSSQSQKIRTGIEHNFEALSVSPKNKTIAYLIWKGPYMLAGQDTFIHQMIGKMGLQNACAENRYPEYSPEALTALNPDYIFLSSEPYPFKEKHMEEFRSLCPNAKVLIVDGEAFSWYGSRLLQSPDYFRELLLKL